MKHSNKKLNTHYLGQATVLLCLILSHTTAFSPFAIKSGYGSGNGNSMDSLANLDTTIETSRVIQSVAVAGATGRTGRLVVQELLDRGVPTVIALVRDQNKAKEVLPISSYPNNLKIIKCDLSQKKEIQNAIQRVDAAIWCATGFSDANADPFEKIKRLLGLALAPRKTIDAIGLPAIADVFANQDTLRSQGDAMPVMPRIVMCSSAGVTRPTWDATKKERLAGAADIPIVRLNPFGILDVKRESEEELRKTCSANDIPYCIVRPCGLNDKWPVGSRPIFSQGDVAVGRINRKDVATVLVDTLTTPEATDKTFEVVGLAGYPPAVSVRRAVSRLLRDDELPSNNVPDEIVMSTYTLMQQLLPGERQDAASLAMGQTYEELDQGKTGRLGERGRENVEGAVPKPSA